MPGSVTRVVWFRFGATWRRRRGGYLTLVLLIGLIGGIALGSIAAARRTQSSYATFLASTNPSDMSLNVQGPIPSMGTGALIATGIEPPAMQKFLGSANPTLNGPGAVFVRLKSGVAPAAGLRSLQRIADAGTRAFQALPPSLYTGQSVDVLPVQYPAEIENYRSVPRPRSSRRG